MKKRLLILVLLLNYLLQMQAIPARPGIWKTAKLANGQTVLVELKGDENMHFWQSKDGKQFTIDENELAVPADMNALYAQARFRLANANLLRDAAMDDAPNKNRRTTRATPARTSNRFVGSKKGLVILVSFANKDFSMSNPKRYYEKVLNRKNLTETPFRGSVRDYFLAQSEGKFDLTFDVAGPVKLDNYETYGANEGGERGNDTNVPAMIVAAVNAIAKDYNFAKYDWDGDGVVEQVYVIYAGRGEATGGAANTIWPHKYYLGSKRVTHNNVIINTYACSNELDTETTLAGIGTICHEFTHCLGLPDFYDIDYEKNGLNLGMGTWDLMSGGNHNDNGFCPPNYTSYEKMFVGWKDPIELSEKTEVANMGSLTNNGDAYVIYNQGNRNEYYLLENRQRKGWDAYIPASGLLAIHVDYDAEIWAYNMPNTTGPYGSKNNTHERMAVVSAGNNPNRPSLAPYPQGENNTLSNSSTPSAAVYNENTDHSHLLNAAVNGIKQNNDGTISFSFIVNQSNNKPLPAGTLFYESFDGCAGTGGNDNRWFGFGDFAAATFHPDNNGWEGAARYGANGCARFGSMDNIGTITTPEITLDGKDELLFKVAPYGVDDATLTISVTGDAKLETSTFTMTANSFTTFKTAIEGKGKVRITFKPGRRFFLDEVIVKSPNTSDIRGIKIDDNSPITVYDLQGHRLLSVPAAQFNADALPVHGVFIVKQGDKSHKIVR